jgi:hypothetical protein
MTYYTEKEQNCQPHKRCKNFKTCDTCNRIRQAHLSDITELASRFSNHSQYAVVMPFAEAQEHIKEIKTKITRKIRKSTNGAMITVESSNSNALHLNFIINSDKPLTSKPFSQTLEKMGYSGSVFIDELKKPIEVRRATAYSLKRESIPTYYQYSGNIMNTTGNLSTFKEIIHSKRMSKYNPYIKIAGLQIALKELGLPVLPSNTPQDQIKKIADLINQIQKLDKCYSDKYGLLSFDEFTKYYIKYIKSIKTAE